MEIKLSRNLTLAGLRKSFTKVNELDLGRGRISLFGNNVAGYCTSIPVSDPSYRKRHPTQARAAYKVKDGWHEFTVWDDWGTRHEVSISDDAEGRELAAKQLESLQANELLQA